MSGIQGIAQQGQAPLSAPTEVAAPVNTPVVAPSAMPPTGANPAPTPTGGK